MRNTVFALLLVLFITSQACPCQDKARTDSEASLTAAGHIASNQSLAACLKFEENFFFHKLLRRTYAQSKLKISELNLETISVFIAQASIHLTLEQINCIAHSAELAQFASLLDPSTANLTELSRRVYSNVLANFNLVDTTIAQISKDYLFKNYEAVASNLVVLVKTLLAEVPEINQLQADADPLGIIKQMLTAFASTAGIAAPSDCLPCFQNSNPQAWVDFGREALKKGANLNVLNIGDLLDTIKKFGNSLSPETDACFTNGQDFKNFEAKYNLAGLTVDQIKSRAETNIALHLAGVLKSVKKMNQDMQDQKYSDVGAEGATLADKIF